MSEQITSRRVNRTLIVPFDRMDEEREDLIQEIIKAADQIAILESKMEPIKKSIKLLSEVKDDSENKLRHGRLEEIECVETIDWNMRKITVTRTDTGDIVDEREITVEDQQMRLETEAAE